MLRFVIVTGTVSGHRERTIRHCDRHRESPGKSRRARRRAYARLLKHEASKPPYSLAETLFVGTADFTRRMLKRFDLVRSSRPRIQRVDLGASIEAIESLPGGRCKQ